jgi:glycosyltransferase involved in cell wall biosynthesis/GT2 family glycosyltransferase
MSSSAPHAAAAPLSILVITPEIPPLDRDAGSLRMFRVLELMAADGHRVTLLARGGPVPNAAVRALEGLGVEVHPADDGTRLDAIVARVRPDVAWLTFYATAEHYLPLLRRLTPATRVVVDTVDVHSLREARAAALTGAAQDAVRAAQTREREAAIYSAADVLVAVSDADGAALAELAPGVPVRVVSIVHPPAPAGPPRAEREGVVFVAGFRHGPNVDAALHLVHDVWPHVIAQEPGAKLSLVGSFPPPAVQALAGPGIEVTGWVPETGPYLDAALVSVAPLRFGAGVKGKVGEALAHGVPVVTTTIGAEGMDLVDGEHALIADDPRALADAIIALHRDADLWERLAQAGRPALARLFSPERVGDALRALLTTLVPRTFVVADGDAEAALAGFLGAFAPSDPVSLAVALAPGADADALYGRLIGRIGALGHDPERIPDVAVHLWADGAVAPAGAVGIDAAAPPEAWRAALASEPDDDAATPRASLIVRLPADAAEAAAQLEATLAAGVPVDLDVELLLTLPDGRPAPALPDGARVVRHGPEAGRRGALARALHVARGELVVAIEPHVLPEPGFLAPLLDAVAAGAVLAGPVLDGAHGLRIGPDGALWPRDGDDPAPLDALALDVLAATRATWRAMPAALPPRDGFAETQLAAWASARGPLAVAAPSRVHRAPAPPASVILCTRDRHDLLEDVVELVVAQGAAELLIVDNGSTDATPAVAAALAERHPGVVRVVDEPEAGLSRARNAGARAASHDLLIYLDDDARPAPGWLPAFARELARDGVVSAGGPITGLWPAERAPDWPAPGLEPLYGVLDHGDGDRTLVPPDIVYGGNWGIRRVALDAAGGFDPHLGVAPGVRIGGEEAAVAWRLQRGGLGETRYVAAAAVGHLIGTHRLTDRFLAERGLTVGLERPRHAADPGALMPQAQRAAALLHHLSPQHGTHRLEDVLDAVVAGPLPSGDKVTAAMALGELAACVLLLGTTQVEVGDLTLVLQQTHLDGLLEPVAV